MLCLEADEPNREQVKDGLVVLDSTMKNSRMFPYRVVSTGHGVAESTGVSEGDWVFVDMLSRFADTFPISFVRTAGLICGTDRDGKTLKAIKGQIVVKYNRVVEKTVNGLIQTENLDPYGTVVSIGIGCADRGFSIGDRVSITSDQEAGFAMSDGVYFIYDANAPLFRFKENR